MISTVHGICRTFNSQGIRRKKIKSHYLGLVQTLELRAGNLQLMHLKPHTMSRVTAKAREYEAQNKREGLEEKTAGSAETQERTAASRGARGRAAEEEEEAAVYPLPRVEVSVVGSCSSIGGPAFSLPAVGPSCSRRVLPESQV